MKHSYLVVYSYSDGVIKLDGNINILTEKQLKYYDLEKTKDIINKALIKKDIITTNDPSNVLILNIIKLKK